VYLIVYVKNIVVRNDVAKISRVKGTPMQSFSDQEYWKSQVAQSKEGVSLKRNVLLTSQTNASHRSK